MLPYIIEDFEGDLWIDCEDKLCKVNVSIQIPEFNIEKKNELIKIAKNKKNAAVVGIVSKIRNAIENFFLNEDNIEALAISSGGFCFDIACSEDYSSLWSLDNYRTNVKKEEHAEAWDELEKSVISSVADDVIVGVKGNIVNIIIVKKFA